MFTLAVGSESPLRQDRSQDKSEAEAAKKKKDSALRDKPLIKKGHRRFKKKTTPDGTIRDGTASCQD